MFATMYRVYEGRNYGLGPARTLEMSFCPKAPLRKGEIEVYVGEITAPSQEELSKKESTACQIVFAQRRNGRTKDNFDSEWLETALNSQQ